MEYTAKRKQKNPAKSINRETKEDSGSMNQAYLQAVLAGKARADAETMGHRQDLAPSINAKMSKAFGMDLSQLKLYRSAAMEGTDTRGVASGNKIVLSRDIDLNTMAGQAVLGHEISHVRAQSQGIGMGHTGLYNDASLEHQADAEGMMAARGQSILGENSGMDMGLGMGGIGGLTPLGAGMSASAGAPMQASGKGKKKKAKKKADSKAGYQLKTEIDNMAKPEILSPTVLEPAQAGETNQVPEDQSGWQELLNNVPFMRGEDDLSFSKWKRGKTINNNFSNFAEDASKTGGKRVKRLEALNDDIPKTDRANKFGNGYTDRIVAELMLSQVGNASKQEDLEKLMKDLYASDPDEEAKKAVQLQIKEIYYQSLLQRQKEFGRLPAQMDPDDLAERSGMNGFGAALRTGLQFSDANEGVHNVEFKDAEKEAEYQRIHNFYTKLQNVLVMKEALQNALPDEDYESNEGYQAMRKELEELGESMKGPGMNEEQLAEYRKAIEEQKKKKEKEKMEKKKK